MLYNIIYIYIHTSHYICTIYPNQMLRWSVFSRSTCSRRSSRPPRQCWCLQWSLFQATASILGGEYMEVSMGDTPIAGWIIMEDPAIYIYGWFGGTPILGHLHIYCDFGLDDIFHLNNLWIFLGGWGLMIPSDLGRFGSLDLRKLPDHSRIATWGCNVLPHREIMVV